MYANFYFLGKTWENKCHTSQQEFEKVNSLKCGVYRVLE